MAESSTAMSDFVSEQQEEETEIMYNASSNRQKPIEEMQEEDRISALPDSLLLHILSLLFAGDLIKTSTLSKRWQFLWTSVPSLKLDEAIQMKSRKYEFVSSVYGILVLRGHNKLKEFYVNASNYFAHFNVWIRYAVVCNVEELVIYTVPDDDYELYNLPVHLFRNSCLTKLDLYYCNLEPIVEINWKSLKRLYIGHACITQELISNILSGSPSLERLKLSYCEGSGFDVLNFTSISLRKLGVCGYNGNQHHSKVLKIRAPNVLSLKITEDMSTLNVILLDVPSLVEAYLDLWLDEVYDIESIAIAYEAQEEMLKKLINSLQHVNEVKLGKLSLEVLSRLKDKDFTCPPNMKSHVAS